MKTLQERDARIKTYFTVNIQSCNVQKRSIKSHKNVITLSKQIVKAT